MRTNLQNSLSMILVYCHLLLLLLNSMMKLNSVVLMMTLTAAMPLFEQVGELEISTF